MPTIVVSDAKPGRDEAGVGVGLGRDIDRSQFELHAVGSVRHCGAHGTERREASPIARRLLPRTATRGR